MTRAELSDMIGLAERLMAAGEPAVLATLFASNGSTYRTLGSMMVSGPASMIAGGVSGGCLEEYIARHGRLLIQQQASAMLSFNTNPDGEADGKPILGCGGSIEVLVERCTPEHIVLLRQLQNAYRADAISTLACVIDTSDSPSLIVNRCWLTDTNEHAADLQLTRLRARSIAMESSRHGMLGPHRRALVHYIHPMTRLVILGAGNDARPLTAIAQSLDWHVTVADRRARLATRARFPDVGLVIADDWLSLIEQITFTPCTAVLLMTHSLADDIEILPLLVEKTLLYVGALGPEHRRRWLLEGIERTSRQAVSPAFAARFRGPIGLNLGDRSATGIAVSIVAEILATINDRSAVSLSKPVNLAVSELGQETAAPHLLP